MKTTNSSIETETRFSSLAINVNYFTQNEKPDGNKPTEPVPPQK